MKSIKRILGVCILAIGFIVFMPILSKAAVDDNFVIKYGSINLSADKYGERILKLKKPGLLYIAFTINLKNGDISDGSCGIRVSIKGYNETSGTLIYKDAFKMKIPKNDDETDWWFFSEKSFDAGTYFEIEFDTFESYDDEYGSRKFRCEFAVYQYDRFSSKINMPTKLLVKTDHDKRLKIKNLDLSKSFLGMTFSSSNEDVASVWRDNEQNVYVWGKRAGKCVITATLLNGAKYKCRVTVKNPPPKIQYSKINLYKGQTLKNKVLYASKKVVWSSSNNRIATVSSKGKIKAKSTGNCIITAESNGKIYKAKVYVSYREPNYVAELYEYNTRENYFILRVRNIGEKSLTICSNQAKICDYDYKIYDRNLWLANGNDVIIEPGKKKSLRFNVKGTVTWYDVNDFWIGYYIIYDGKKYYAEANADRYDSTYKKNSKGFFYTYYKNVDIDKYSLDW